MLLPQDIVVALKIALAGRQHTYAELAHALEMSASQVHGAVERCDAAGLLVKDGMKAKTSAILEFAIHGVKYVYPPERLPVQRGLPTAHSAAPLKDLIVAAEPIVWPDPRGEVRGEALAPIHRSVPGAARKDEKLYQALALVDAIRAGRTRERKLAEDLLKKLLSHGDHGS